MTTDRVVPEGIVAARTAARRVLERFGVRAPEDIDVALFAAAYGAFVSWSDTGPEDAHVVRVPEGALIVIRKDKRGTPRARFSTAHEFGHHLRHPDFDAIERVHGAPRTSGKEFRIEREADAFAVELLMPEALLVDTCAEERPSFRDVLDVARRFGTSLMATGRRWTELAEAPCAMLESKDGVVTRVDKTRAFRGDVARGRPLVDALAALKGATLEWADVPETGAALTWAWHSAAWREAETGETGEGSRTTRRMIACAVPPLTPSAHGHPLDVDARPIALDGDVFQVRRVRHLLRLRDRLVDEADVAVLRDDWIVSVAEARPRRARFASTSPRGQRRRRHRDRGDPARIVCRPAHAALESAATHTKVESPSFICTPSLSPPSSASRRRRHRTRSRSVETLFK